MIDRAAIRRFPSLLLMATGVLLLIGLVAVTSASYQPTQAGYSLDPYKQMIWIAVGLGVGAVCVVIDYRIFGDRAYLLYILGLATLGACFLFGAVNGSQRWIELHNSIKIQPSEFMKVVMPLVLARYLAGRDLSQKWSSIVPPLLIAAVPTLMILKQPDLGTALVFPPMVLIMLWVAGARKRHLAALLLCAALIGAAFYFSPVIKPHQKSRIDTFLFPSSASVHQEGYQLTQSRIAIGSGGLIGRGFRNGSQNYLGYVPFDSTDFIFAVIGEEWGFLGTTLTLSVLLVLIASGLFSAASARDPLGRLAAVGLVTPIAMQVLVNTSMTIGLVPITGVTLPLISYGGSSMIATLAAVGLICNVSMRRVIVLASERSRVSMPHDL